MRSDWRLAAAAIVVSGLVGSTGATPALAQGRPAAGSPASDKARKDGARKEYKEGERLLKLGRYKDAFEHYRTADDLLPIAATKYKMAVCLDRQGKILESVTSYQVFLDAAPPPDKLADAISDARARLEVLRRTPGKIRITVDPPGLARLGLQVDGGPVYAPPPDRTLTVPPGHHRITATAAGYDATSAELDLGFGESRELRLTLNVAGRTAPALPAPVAALGVQPPPAAGAPAPPPQAGAYQGTQAPSRVPAYVLLGVAGAGAVVGAVFGAQALGAKSDFNKAHTVANADREQRDARIADIALFSALGLAVVGTVLLFVPRSPPDAAVGGAAAPRGFVAPYFGPTGGGATGTVTF